MPPFTPSAALPVAHAALNRPGWHAFSVLACLVYQGEDPFLGEASPPFIFLNRDDHRYRSAGALDHNGLFRVERRHGRDAIHLVSVWAQTNHLVLGQTKVDAKSNEIAAMPELLSWLDLAGCLVTIDAMGCQIAIAAQIVRQGGDYLLALKANQPRLCQDVREALHEDARPVRTEPHPTYARTVDEGHGRLEVRECWALSDPALTAYLTARQPWPHLRTVVRVRPAAGGRDHQRGRPLLPLQPGGARPPVPAMGARALGH